MTVAEDKSDIELKKTTHISPLWVCYGVSVVWICEKIDRVTTKPHCDKMILS